MLLFNFWFALFAAFAVMAQQPAPTALETLSYNVATQSGSKCQASVPTGLTKEFQDYASKFASYAKDNGKAISSVASGCTELAHLTIWAQCASAWTDLAEAATATDNGVPKETGRALAAAAVAGIIAAAL